MKTGELGPRTLSSGFIIRVCGTMMLAMDVYCLFRFTIIASMLVCCLSAVAFMLVYGAVKKSFPLAGHMSIFGLLTALAPMALISLVAGLLLELLTIFGLSDSLAGGALLWSRERLAIFVVTAFFFQVGFIYIRAYLRNSYPEAAADSLFDRKGIAFLGTCVSSAALIAVLLAVMLGGTYSVTYRSLLLVLELLLSIAFVFLAIKFLGRKVEFLFLALAITLGSYLSFALPPVTNLAPDDQIHYERALGLSFLGHGEVGALEGELVDVPWGRGGGLNHERIDEFCKRMEEVGSDSNATDNGRESIGFEVPVSGESYLFVPIVGAIPSALGLWMGRLLHLSFVGTFILGRWFNLLFYVLVVFGAIGITPVKKVLFAVVGLLPTALFLASGYSYDPWLLALSMLGLALFARLYCGSPAGSVTVVSLVPCLIVFTLAIMVKAVYFPLIGLLFLIPARQCASREEARRCRVSVLVLALLLVLSFVLPMLFSPAAQAGDVRGGTDVNALGQVSYILHHPLAYTGTLLRFMLNYVSPASSNGYSIYYAYVGSDISVFPLSAFSTVPFIILLLSAQVIFGDETPPIFTFKSKCWISLLVFLMISLSATALFVSFTGVGSGEIAGMQPRYLLPLLCPAFMMVRTRCVGEEPLASLLESRIHVITLPGVIAAISGLSVLLDFVWVASW